MKLKLPVTCSHHHPDLPQTERHLQTPQGSQGEYPASTSLIKITPAEMVDLMLQKEFCISHVLVIRHVLKK